MTISPRDADDFLNLRGVACPANAARALLRLEGMATGQILEILIDDGEPMENVPEALRQERHEVLHSEKQAKGWRLLIKAG